MQRPAHVIGQGIGRDVVRLHERGVEQIAQRDRVARLKTDIVFARPGEGGFGNDRHLREIAAFFGGPIEHDHRGRDFRQAADLALLIGLQFIEDEAGLGVHRDGCLGPCRALRCARKKRQNSGEEQDFARENDHGGQNRCTLTGAIRLATAIIAPHAGETPSA